MVRRVLGSVDFVVPLFKWVIKGGPAIHTVSKITRILIILNRSVDKVFDALGYVASGDIYFHKVGYATVENIVKALIADHSIGLKVVGIRPCRIVNFEEKIHHCGKVGERILF